MESEHVRGQKVKRTRGSLRAENRRDRGRGLRIKKRVEEPKGWKVMTDGSVRTRSSPVCHGLWNGPGRNTGQVLTRSGSESTACWVSRAT